MSPTPLPNIKRIGRTPDEADARMARIEVIVAVLLAVAGSLLAAAFINTTGGPR